MKLYKEIGKAFFVGSLIFIIIGVIEYFNGWRINSGTELLIRFIFNQLYSVSLYMVNYFLINFLFKKYNDWFSLRLILRGIIGSIAISIFTIFILRLFTALVFEGISLSEFISNERPQFYYVTLIIAIVVTSIFYIFYYYKATQERKVKEQKIIAGTASAKFDALKNQLDPHFLFNSLNVLTSLIEENPQAATHFTTSLSKVYRYVLEQKNKELVTLTEELAFANLYMSLLKMRFEDSIVYHEPTQLTNSEAKVVPLSLQLLLENAVKHNQVTPQNKLTISIIEEEGNLVVKNNLQPKKIMKESSGVGLKNIYQRYSLLTQKKVTIQKDENYFWVTLPLLTQKISFMNTQTDYIATKRYDRAKKHVEELKGFYIHFAIYMIMVPMFIYFNLKSTSFPWAIFPIAGWGMGVLGHAMEVFNWNPIFNKNWEERKIKELMDKDK